MAYYVSNESWERDKKKRGSERVNSAPPLRQEAREHLALKQPNKESRWEARRERGKGARERAKDSGRDAAIQRRRHERL